MEIKGTHSFIRTIIVKIFAFLIIACFISLSANAADNLSIAFPDQWNTGAKTLERAAKSLRGTNIKIDLISMSFEAVVPALLTRKTEMIIVSRNFWFETLFTDNPFVAVAEIGPFLPVVEKAVLDRKWKIVKMFLNAWQKEWIESGLPYGIQPPDPLLLMLNYNELAYSVVGGKSVSDTDRFKDYTAKLIKPVQFKWNARSAIQMTREYYHSFKKMVIHSTNAMPGQEYEGRITNVYSTHLELDKNPCNFDIVYFKEPYTKTETDKTVECEGKNYKIYLIVKN
jgi:hypothetical protein